MNLGLSRVGNNWKYALGNFLVVFAVQLLFNLNDLMNTPDVWPTGWLCAKTLLISAVSSLVFFGYNKAVKKE